MKKNIFFLLVISTILFSVNIVGAVNFKISGEVFKLVKSNPASRTMVYINENPDSSMEKVNLEGAKITIYYGSTFFQMDTTKPKILEPIIKTDVNGLFTINGKLDTSQTKKLAITVEKDGFIGCMRPFDFDPIKNEYKIYVYMIEKMVFKKK